MVYMSAGDLARWSRALHDGTVLGPGSLREMLAFRRPAPGEPYSGFGLGTGEFRIGGTSLWGHLGWHYGYTTAMFYAPGRGTSIAVLINDNNMPAIHAAALGLWVLTEMSEQKARSFALALAVAVLFSPLVLSPLAAVARRLRPTMLAVRRPSLRIPPPARGVALVAPLLFAAATGAYVAYGVNPEGPLAWSGGTHLARAVLVLGVLSVASCLTLAVLAVVAWAQRQGRLRERAHYSLVALAALFLVQQLATWSLPPF
jgi:hypothetical protein